MELEEINELCYRIMSFYDYTLRCNNLNYLELEKNMKDEYKENLFKVKGKIDEKVIKKICKNPTKYRDIFNYCIVFDEELINNELLIYLLNNNYISSNYLNVLMMNKELNDDIVSFIIDKYNLVRHYTGKKPYDYRYHIIKRTEISDNIKNDLLKTYDKDELESIIREIGFDLEDEFNLNNIRDKKALRKNKELYKEYIAYNTMRDYMNQKVYKK